MLSKSRMVSEESVMPSVGPNTAAIWIVNSLSASGIFGSLSSRWNTFTSAHARSVGRGLLGRSERKASRVVGWGRGALTARAAEESDEDHAREEQRQRAHGLEVGLQRPERGVGRLRQREQLDALNLGAT